MRADQPQVSRLRNRDRWRLGDLFLRRRLRARGRIIFRKQAFQFLIGEADDAGIKSLGFDCREFLGQKVIVPSRA